MEMDSQYLLVHCVITLDRLLKLPQQDENGTFEHVRKSAKQGSYYYNIRYAEV